MTHRPRLGLCLILTILGCRHASIQDDPNWPSPGPVDVASLPPIHSVINHGTTDPDALLEARSQGISPSVPKQGSMAHAGNPIVLGPISRQEDSTTLEPGPTAPQVVAADPPAMPQPTEVASQGAVLAAPVSSPAAVDSAVRSTGSADIAPITPPLAPSEPPNAPITPPVAPIAPPAKSEDRSVSVSTDSSKDISGTPPKEIDFDGLPDSAVSAGRVAAKIGMKVITVYDLNVAIQEWIRANVPAGQSIPRRDGLFIARMVLSQMVDRTLIVQEAHRMMKSEKQKDALFKQIEQVWKDQQIPPMLKKYKVDTPYELDEVLKKQGRSLEAARQEFMDDALAHEFMGMKLSGKTFVSLVEMRRYYNDHVADYDRPAQLTWREIRIPFEAGKEAAALEKANSVLLQIRNEPDFAAIAKRVGKGPTADQGGLWETSPGAFAIAEINSALEGLSPGQVSEPIKTDNAIFIIKLEARREAGPARFDEVQAEIKKKLAEVKLTQAASGYIQDLRKKSVIHTIFDDLPDPRQPMADKELKRTNNSAAASGALSSPQSNNPPIPPDAPPTRPEIPLRDLNPAGPPPARGVMSGPAVSPL